MRWYEQMRTLLLAGALVIGLAGCTPAVDVAAPTPSASTSAVTPSPTATPTPTPTVATKPDLADMVISHDGLGPVAIGTDLAALDPALSIFEATESDCGDGPFAEWSASYPDRPLGNSVHAFDSGRQQGGFSYVMIYGPGPHTPEGIEVGNSLTLLRDAYPGMSVVSAGAGLDRYALYGSPANLFFEVGNGESSFAPDVIASIGISVGDPAAGRPSFHTPSAGCS